MSFRIILAHKTCHITQDIIQITEDIILFYLSRLLHRTMETLRLKLKFTLALEVLNLSATRSSPPHPCWPCPCQCSRQRPSLTAVRVASIYDSGHPYWPVSSAFVAPSSLGRIRPAVISSQTTPSCSGIQSLLAHDRHHLHGI